MLTFRELLASTEPKERRAMLAAKVEDMLNTVVRQIAFYSFERKLHTERRHGELTAEEICGLWMSVQAESLGPAIELGPGYETFWAYIPHFIHSPFYVYAYAFGDCLVNSLYGVYRARARRFCRRDISPCWPPAAPSITPNCWRRSASMRAIPPSGRSASR